MTSVLGTRTLTSCSFSDDDRKTQSQDHEAQLRELGPVPGARVDGMELPATLQCCSMRNQAMLLRRPNDTRAYGSRRAAD